MCVTLKHQIFHKLLANYLHCKVAICVSPVKQPTGLIDSSPFQPPALQFVLTFTYSALSQGLEGYSRNHGFAQNIVRNSGKALEH